MHYRALPHSGDDCRDAGTAKWRVAWKDPAPPAVFQETYWWPGSSLKGRPFKTAVLPLPWVELSTARFNLTGCSLLL